MCGVWDDDGLSVMPAVCAGSRVQCGSRAVNTDGDPGLESLSPATTISRTDGICEPRVMGSVGAEPFTAKLRYTGRCAAPTATAMV